MNALDARAAKAARSEQLIRDYFEFCNRADAAGIASCFTSDAVHYFPPGMYRGPFRGADVIAERWVWAVETLGSHWTVDEVICDPDTDRAVIEWTHHKRAAGVVLRGDEWYRFAPESGLISEIRAYYASPQTDDLARMELQGFPYTDRGYPAIDEVT